jgi:hypothetical protein
VGLFGNKMVKRKYRKRMEICSSKIGTISPQFLRISPKKLIQTERKSLVSPWQPSSLRNISYRVYIKIKKLNLKAESSLVLSFASFDSFGDPIDRICALSLKPQ